MLGILLLLPVLAVLARRLRLQRPLAVAVPPVSHQALPDPQFFMVRQVLAVVVVVTLAGPEMVLLAARVLTVPEMAERVEVLLARMGLLPVAQHLDMARGVAAAEVRTRIRAAFTLGVGAPMDDPVSSSSGINICHDPT